jgi:hypothetical protein
MSEIQFRDYLAICNAKAQYCRCLDTKDWAGFGDVFTEDAVMDTTASGGVRVEGRATLLDFVRKSLTDTKTAHHVHSPEITLADADTADVIWAMQDRVIWSEERKLTGYGHYRERYVRGGDGRWRIASTALLRLIVEFATAPGK